MRYVTALRALSGDRRRTVLAATLMLLPVRVALRFRSIAAVQRACRRVGPHVLRRPAADPALSIPWGVTTAARHMPGARHCLTKAVVATALLEASGVPATLRLGVRRDDDGVVRGHAWVDGPSGTLMDAGEDPLSFSPLFGLEEAIRDER
jgi:hypothetical protein